MWSVGTSGFDAGQRFFEFKFDLYRSLYAVFSAATSGCFESRAAQADDVQPLRCHVEIRAQGKRTEHHRFTRELPPIIARRPILEN